MTEWHGFKADWFPRQFLLIDLKHVCHGLLYDRMTRIESRLIPQTILPHWSKTCMSWSFLWQIDTKIKAEHFLWEATSRLMGESVCLRSMGRGKRKNWKSAEVRIKTNIIWKRQSFAPAKSAMCLRLRKGLSKDGLKVMRPPKKGEKEIGKKREKENQNKKQELKKEMEETDRFSSP